MNMQVLDARRDSNGGYKVDVTRGQRVGRVSSEWFSRPADERYLSLSELAHSVRDRSDRSRTRVVDSTLIQVEANRLDPERLALILPGTDAPVVPTHWSFGQLASLVSAPAAYPCILLHTGGVSRVDIREEIETGMEIAIADGGDC